MNCENFLVCFSFIFGRVIPVIQRLKQTKDFNLPISVDTYRAAVAREAVNNGASLINDVTGGKRFIVYASSSSSFSFSYTICLNCRDPDMYKTMAELDVPVCLMHMRGDTKTMMHLKDYEDGDVVKGVR